MVRKDSLISMGAFLIASIPAFFSAQTTGNKAPLGSKENPIPVVAVGTPIPNPSTKNKNGKRGSKTNPISGRLHARQTPTR